jgi:sulfur carrier protein ThiS
MQNISYIKDIKIKVMKKLLAVLVLVNSSVVFSQSWQSKIHTESGIEYIIDGNVTSYESIYNKDFIERNPKSNYYYNFRFDNVNQEIVMYNRYEKKIIKYDSLTVDTELQYIQCNSISNNITIEVIDNCVYFSTYDDIENKTSIILFEDAVIYY